MISKRSLGAWRAPEVQDGARLVWTHLLAARGEQFYALSKESPMIVYQRITGKCAPYHTVPEFFHGFGAYSPMPSNT